ncbi:hypothetical protein ILUMI_18501 [Ignelater luminosus]|uniref:Peptidase S1 domain-containing protein n=1 Tax=Ignelater luminosus TaxID=2038154 RepID=A0A8K0CLZ1_IGNLU|nr:hypothetical protein ILUMI_18501 [Ignelater luminosus]
MKSLFCIITIYLLLSYGNGEIMRVAGGQPVKEGEYKYFIQLLVAHYVFNNTSPGFVYCGASLIHRNWILTAAQCFKIHRMIPPQMFTDGWVRAYTGNKKVTSIQIHNPAFIFQNVSRAHLHPRYTFKGTGKNPPVEYDVAVAKLAKPFERNVKTIHLPLGANTQLCTVATIIGAGLINSKDFPELVQYSRTRIKTRNQLSIKPPYDYPAIFYSEVVWAEGHPWLSDTGGPVVCNNLGYSVQHGVTSLVRKYNRTVISQYERVKNHIAFIKQHVPLGSSRKKRGHIKKKSKNLEEEVKSTSLQRKSSFICICVNVILYLKGNF